MKVEEFTQDQQTVYEMTNPSILSEKAEALKIQVSKVHSSDIRNQLNMYTNHSKAFPTQNKNLSYARMLQENNNNFDQLFNSIREAPIEDE